VLMCSQISVGEENRLSLRVYGTEASLEWHQQEPNMLLVRRNDRPTEVYKPGHAFLDAAAQHATRLPPGHPEAFLEAFANIYTNALRTIAARSTGVEPDPLDLDFPNVRDGAIGVHFITASVRSGLSGAWVDAAYEPPGATV
jgi:predicted dehydrogenase